MKTTNGVTDDQLCHLCLRLVKREITPTQYNYWLKIWGVEEEHALMIFKRRLIQSTLRLIGGCIIFTAGLFIVIYSLGR